MVHRGRFQAASGSGNTAALSRDHTIRVERPGLVTITGGKWTTYRNMAEDCVNRAAAHAGLPPRPCPTAELRLDSAAAGEVPSALLHAELPYTALRDAAFAHPTPAESSNNPFATLND